MTILNSKVTILLYDNYKKILYFKAYAIPGELLYIYYIKFFFSIFCGRVLILKTMNVTEYDE